MGMLKCSIAISLSLMALAEGEGRAEGVDNLSFTIRGLRSRQGLVYASLYSKAQGFPEDLSAVIAVGEAAIGGASATIVFRGLAPGRYAMAYFHDENGNKRMDKGMFGLPLEGYGFSNDARGFMGPPSFEAAAFDYDGGSLDLSVSIVY
jgi:uncharacterized protein (DUF2141 family)